MPLAIHSHIDGFYDRNSRHDSLGYAGLVGYEAVRMEEVAAAGRRRDRGFEAIILSSRRGEGPRRGEPRRGRTTLRANHRISQRARCLDR
jgi:hypothetical protein